MKKIINIILGCLLIYSSVASAQTKVGAKAKKKILFVVTNHGTRGNTGKKTGYYLAEVAHPWKVLTDAGYEIDFVSPLGGNPPVDGFDLNDAVNKTFWEDKYYQNKITHSMKPADIHPGAYVAIFYAGGHGAMWDYPDNTALAKIAAQIYEHNGVVGAVCHGPAGLLNVKLKDGSYLIAGKKINGFSDDEERVVKMDNVVPFLLEDKLKERGGIYEKSGPHQEHVTIDGRLITGQNPQSAKGVGEAIKAQLDN